MVFDDDPAEPVYIPIYGGDRPEDPPPSRRVIKAAIRAAIVEVAMAHPEWTERSVYAHIREYRHDISRGTVRRVLKVLARAGRRPLVRD